MSKLNLLLIIIFWINFFFLFHTYFLYHHLIRFLARIFRKKWDRDSSHRPSVSIIIPAHNEESVIDKKIQNCLSLDYPGNKLEIIVASDCSSDKTVEIATRSKDVLVLDYRERSGKTGVINKSASRAGGEILILTDSNTMFEKNSISRMVAYYRDPRIGAVCGHVRLFNPVQSRGLEKEISYRESEAALKHNESLLGCTIGAFGGFYSLRRELYVQLPPNAYSNDDFLTAMRVLQQKKAVIFEPDAVSLEETGSDMGMEFNRRIRIGAGNFQSFFWCLAFLNPFRGFASLAFFSHKVLRWFSPFWLLIILVCSGLLSRIFPFGIVFLLQLVFYIAALAGLVLSSFGKSPKLLNYAYHFTSMNIALFLGFIRYLGGIKSAAWQSTERQA
jgi:cellulose synthase/poly-beta-1,6-N-acetylglucosamine synthase-like glycosyltransferase